MNHIRRSLKLLHDEQRVCQRIVMIPDPGVVVPLVWMYVPDVVPQSPQNIAIEFSIHRPSWWNKFLMRDALNVKLLPQFQSVFIIN